MDKKEGMFYNIARTDKTSHDINRKRKEKETNIKVSKTLKDSEG